MAAHAQALKLAHITPPTHVWHQVSERFASELDEASSGQMKVAVSPLQKLGNEGQVTQLMQGGAVQFAVFTAAGLANREESLLGWSLPYVFKGVAHASRAGNTPAAREMLKRLAASGLVGPGYTYAGMRHVLSLQPAASSKDLANKKIRSFPSPIYNDWWKAQGAAPTAMLLSEVAPSLTTKLLDAVDVDLDALVGLKFYQQAPNLTLTNHIAFPGVIVASKRWLDPPHRCRGQQPRQGEGRWREGRRCRHQVLPGRGREDPRPVHGEEPADRGLLQAGQRPVIGRPAPAGRGPLQRGGDSRVLRSHPENRPRPGDKRARPGGAAHRSHRRHHERELQAACHGAPQGAAQ